MLSRIRTRMSENRSLFSSISITLEEYLEIRKMKKDGAYLPIPDGFTWAGYPVDDEWSFNISFPSPDTKRELFDRFYRELEEKKAAAEAAIEEKAQQNAARPEGNFDDMSLYAKMAFLLEVRLEIASVVEARRFDEGYDEEKAIDGALKVMIDARADGQNIADQHRAMDEEILRAQNDLERVVAPRFIDEDQEVDHVMLANEIANRPEEIEGEGEIKPELQENELNFKQGPSIR